MKLMQEAGYDGRQAAQVWDNLLGELKVTGGDDVAHRSAMFATHPPAGNRRDDLLALAGDRGGRLGESEFRKAIAPLRFQWIRDEIRRGQSEESLVLFDRLLARDKDDVEVLYARGEVRLHATIFDGVRRGVAIAESIWPNTAYDDGKGINTLTGADAIAPYGGAAVHDTRVWVRRA